jgi:putative transposase
MCRVLRVSRSGFYSWNKRGVTPRMLRRHQLLEEIRKIHQESRGTYGSPRITRELRKNGIVVNKKTVAEIMKENGIQAKQKKRFKPVTTDSNHNLPVAKNRLKRDFRARKPNRVWVSDITYLRTDEGWLYLAVFIDLCTRKVVGWSMSERITAELAVNAFRMALFRQKGQAPKLVHSDRGSQYASHLFRGELKAHGCKQSMSRKGDCFDNAVAESFFGILKSELIHHEKYKTREQARLSVFDYVETFYNKVRLHSYLSYLSPVEFENSLETA